MDYRIELNNAIETKESGKFKKHSPVVEVFSALVSGKELSSLNLGAKADKAVKYIEELASKAEHGDVNAVSELNELRTLIIQPRIMEEIKLLGLFGSYQALNWGDTVYLKKRTYHNVSASVRQQAEGLDVSTPFFRDEKVALAPITISGGHEVNYRQLQFGDAQAENELMNEVQKQMRNKATNYVIKTVFDAIKTATGVKYFYEGSPIAKSGVDALLQRINRFGQANILGDYSVLSKITSFAGFFGTTNGGITLSGVSDNMIDAVNDNGILGKYNGAILQKLDNPYDISKINSAGTDYETVLPAGLAFVTPVVNAGGVAPIQTFSIGGLTSFTGNDVTTGTIMTRFDLAIACGVASTDGIGMIHDTTLDSLV